MKKVLLIFITVFVVAGTFLGIFFVLRNAGVLDSNKFVKDEVIVKEIDGLIYTERNWQWKPIESDEIISYIDTSTVEKQIVSMHLDGTKFYNVIIPDVEIINDFGKTIWAVDGSFTIRVIGGANLDNLSSIAGISDSQSINQRTLCNRDGEEGSRQIVTLIDDYAILANINSGNENFSVICDSLSRGRASHNVDYVPILDKEELTVLDSLSYSGKYYPQVDAKNISIIAQQYLFEDGELWLQTDLNPIYRTKSTYLSRLYKYSGQEIDTVYSSDKIYYAKSGEYHLAIISNNSNTTNVMIGYGDECYCNIVYALSFLQ